LVLQIYILKNNPKIAPLSHHYETYNKLGF